MSFVHLHLIVSHLPVLWVPLGVAIVGLGWALRQPIVRRVGYGIMIVGGVTVGAVFWTGEQAEHRLEDRVGFAESAIETHEAAAKYALVMTYFAAAIAGLCLVLQLRQSRYESVALVGVIVIGVLASVSLGTTASHGGAIRHTEIHELPPLVGQ